MSNSIVVPHEEWCNEVDHKLDTLTQSNRLILEAIKGNPISGDKGFVGQIDELKRLRVENTDRIEKLEKFKERAFYAFLGGSPFVTWGIKDMIIALFEKHQ